MAGCCNRAHSSLLQSRLKQAPLWLNQSLRFYRHVSVPAVKVAVASGIANARELIEEIKAGKVQYDFVEVMSCPGGCIGGGGQPKTRGHDVLQKRMDAVYNIDQHAKLRKSHENPEVKASFRGCDTWFRFDGGGEVGSVCLCVGGGACHVPVAASGGAGGGGGLYSRKRSVLHKLMDDF